MNRENFQNRFSRATDSAVSFARTYVLNELPNQRVFLIFPNQSFDGNPLDADEATYPSDTQVDDKPIVFATAEAVVDSLWKDSKVPEWIDVSVGGADGEHTYIHLLCCGRFTATDELLYHRDGGVSPFSVKSPILPPGYNDAAEADTQKFDVNWREKAKRDFQERQKTEGSLLCRLLRSIRSLIGGK